MASWMVHLRITDQLLDRIGELAPTEFVVGNIAPDSGVPNEDWSKFTPDSETTHFKRKGINKDKDICIEDYVNAYFTKEMQRKYDKKQYSFFLGYLTHLLTDILWYNNIVTKTLEKYPDECAKDRTAFIWTIKRDWYDLDHLYLDNHPEFRAFDLYEKAVGFENKYMDIFPDNAFDDRRIYITGFYRQERNDLDHEYVYLTEPEMAKFVDESVETILSQLKEIL